MATLGFTILFFKRKKGCSRISYVTIMCNDFHILHVESYFSCVLNFLMRE
jgi:hypothetical protein